MNFEGINLLPPIRRARDWHLYDHRGRRYLDLWQENGLYLTGRRPEGLYHTMKNLLSPGLAGGFPTVHLKRLEKILAISFPANGGRLVFSHETRALDFCRKTWGRDPVFWRPGTDLPEGMDPVWPLLPYGPLQSRIVLTGTVLGPGDLISGLEAAGLMEVLRSHRNWEDRRRRENWDHHLWSPWSLAPWRRQGPYLWAPACRDYPGIFRHFLGNGFILSPDPEHPSLLPSQYSPGELALFRKTNEEAPWNS